MPKLLLSDLSVKRFMEINPNTAPGLEVIKLFSFSTQLSMKFILLISIKIPVILTFSLLNRAEHEIYLADKH